MAAPLLKNKREKILAAIVGAFAAIFLLIGLYKALFEKPLRKIDGQTALLRQKLESINKEKRAFFAAEDYLKKVASQTFESSAELAAARAGQILTEEISRCGLQESAFSRLPVGPRRLRGADEIGWSIQGQGPLPKIVDLLYAIEKSSALHRVENLTMFQAETAGEVKTRFRFLTLAIPSAPEVAATDVTLTTSSNAPDRDLYDIIVTRNFLAPYVPPPAPQPTTPTSPNVPGETGPNPADFKVVSLSQWNGRPEVLVLDLKSNETKDYVPGDRLAGGEIVTIDYRPLPLPGKAGLLSFSRVIIQIDADYWAVERGQTLADLRKLNPDELPSGLTVQHP